MILARLPWFRTMALFAVGVLAVSAAEPKATTKKPSAPPTPWSFQPLKESPLPKVRNDKWPQSRVDHFLLAKMEKAGVKPAVPADPRVLIRRLHFDLTGLPPTHEEVEIGRAHV